MPDDRAPHEPGVEIHRGALLLAAALSFGALGIFHFLYEHRPLVFIDLFAEDGWAESMSFVAWVLAGGLWLRLAWLRPAPGRLTLIAVGVLALLVAGEEISWGQRLFGWSSPDYFLRENRQAETNLHNLVVISPFYRALPWLIAGGCVVPWSLIRLSAGVRELVGRLSVPIVPVHLWPFFFAASLAFTDLFRGDHEVGELLLALAVCVLAAQTWRPGGRRTGSSLVIASMAVPLLVVVPGLTWALLAITPPPRESSAIQWATTRLLKRQYDQAETTLAELAPTSPAERSEVLALWALSLDGLDRREEAVERSRGHVDLVLGGARLTSETVERLPTPHEARLLSLSLCRLERHEEAVLALRQAQAMDMRRLKQPLEANDEAMTRASLAATLHGLGLKSRGHDEIVRAERRAESFEIRQKARKVRRRMRSFVELSECDLSEAARHPPREEESSVLEP